MPMRRATCAIRGVASPVTTAAAIRARAARPSDGILDHRAVRLAGSATAQIGDYVVDRVHDGLLGVPADGLTDRARVRYPMLQVLEPLLVCDVEGHEPDPGGGASAFDDHPSQVDDLDGPRRPDVVDAPQDAVGIDQPQQRADGIPDVKEATRLLAVAEDREIGAGQRLADEPWEHHAVGPHLPRSNDV